MVKVSNLNVIQVYLPNSKFLKPIIEDKVSNIVDNPDSCYITARLSVEINDKDFDFNTFVKVPYLPVDNKYLNLLMKTDDRNELDDKLVMYALENIDEITDIYIDLLTEDPDFSQSFDEAIMEFAAKHGTDENDEIIWYF